MTTEDAQAVEKVALADAKPCIRSESHGPHSWNGYPPDIWHCPGRSRLTEADVTLLAEAFGGATPSVLLTTRVERIVAARVAEAVERERAAWVAKVADAEETALYHQRLHSQTFRQSQALLVRAEAAEQALAALREDCEALIAPRRVRDAISGDVRDVPAHFVKARHLRAVLDGGVR